MIKISCSRLEEVRNNPSQFVQQLVQDKNSSGGTFGMFACWQTKIKAIHKEELSLMEALKGLQQRFMSFADTPKNRKKQEFLIDRVREYLKDFEGQNLNYWSSPKLISWKIIPEVALTGYTPVLCKKGKKYVCYFFSEEMINWKQQLKFPLIQYYLAKNIFSCDFKNVEIGYYSLSAMEFDLKCYTEEDIEDAINEATSIFKFINSEFKNSRKAS